MMYIAVTELDHFFTNHYLGLDSLVLRVATAIVVLLLASASAAGAHEGYSIVGKDELQVAGTNVESLTSYNGSQYVSVTSAPNGIRRFLADATVRVRFNKSSSDESALAELVLSPDGHQHIIRNDDPAYLTVLTQPFAVALDVSTLEDVAHLRKPIPFRFSSGMTGGDLRGLLAFRGYTVIDDYRVIGMTFTAEGPVYSAMQGKDAPRMIGHVQMNGRAFYRASDALLMKLVTTVVTTGTVASGSATSQVKVTYYRQLEHFTERAQAKPVPTPIPVSTPGTPKALPQ